MQDEGETVEGRRARPRESGARRRAALLLVVYVCAALFGLFHTWDRQSPEPTHVCGASGHDVADRDDRPPAHDEDRCGLCHVLSAPRLLGVAFDGSFIFDRGAGRLTARPRLTPLASTPSRSHRPRGPPAV